MPYAVVETIDAFGNKELLAAPEHWIQSQENGKQYLCWPNVRNITTLNALLEDESSVPSLMWEKHECTVKRRCICSLALANATLEGIQKLTENKTTAERTTPTKSPDTNLTRNIVRVTSLAKQMEDSNHGQENLVEPKIELTFDPLGEGKITPKVSEMFNELKRQIDANQEEMTKKMNEGFYRIQKTLVGLMHKQPEQGQSIGNAASSTRAMVTASKRNECINMKPIKTIEEMNDLETQLKDDTYRRQVFSWIDSVVSYERNPECRMMEILDLLFDRHFLPNFSWTGASAKGVKKHAFGDYRNILQLFAYAGTTNVHRADRTFVANFFMKKLRHAPLRAVTLKGLRRCVPHSPSPRSTKRKQGEASISSNLDNSAKFVKLSKVQFESLMKKNDDSMAGARIQESLDDHQYTDYNILEVDVENDLQPTLFMSAEDEYE
ncbi:uncharacterized protein LOC118503749 [Anopheles stephensi]|uniref:uncharacterized protein LOC118503749 n=1 Tax=Anopheles stephensi TaxID=30069 RepID=UPI0016588014|nr:uncharacterized protein LOC118503749 [Anopheles stephensi]